MSKLENIKARLNAVKLRVHSLEISALCEIVEELAREVHADKQDAAPAPAPKKTRGEEVAEKIIVGAGGMPDHNP